MRFIINIFFIFSIILLYNENTLAQNIKKKYNSKEIVIVKKCPKCGHIETRPYAKYCIYCGTKLIKVKCIKILICPKCKRPLDKNAKYCAFCGKKGVVKYIELPNSTYSINENKKNKKEKEKITKDKKKNELDNILKEIEEYKKRLNKKKDLLDDSFNIIKKNTKNSKDINKNIKKHRYFYPSATLLEKVDIDYGLIHTFAQTKLRRYIFLCNDSHKKVELYYKQRYKKVSVIRLITQDIFYILKLKILINKKNTKIEIRIAHYSLLPYKYPSVLERKHKKIKLRIKREMKALERYKKEIKTLEKLISQGKTALIGRVEELKRRCRVVSNSSTYWDYIALDKLCKLQKNILIITLIKKKI